MERLGKVQEWHDDKGYGFIATIGDATPGDRVFFHIRDYERAGRRPEIGELVRYVPGRQDDGRPRAVSIRRAVQPPPPRSRSKTGAPASTAKREISTPAALILIAAYATGIAWAVNVGRLPIVVGFALAALSVAAYMANALDKHAAERGHWRIQESTLHALEMLGGWSGALLAQRVMRHKTRKTGYRVAFWMSAVINCAALAWWAFRN